jgi:hypothetical protein
MAAQTSYPVSMTAAIEGALADNGNVDIRPYYNGAAAEIAFGRAVKFGASDNAAILPAAETDKIVGITVHSHRYSKGTSTSDLGDTGMRQGVTMDVLRKGRIWVKCEDGCVPGDRLWVRAVAGGAPEYLGGLNNADDSTDMIDCTNQGQWLTTASAEGLAILEVNFTVDAT